jgi:hypothetical protein
MFSPTLVTAPAALLLAIFAAAAAPNLPSSRPDCQPVQGQIDARANRFGLDFHGFKLSGGGTMQGSLAGGVSVEIRRKGRRGPLTDVSVKLTGANAGGPFTLAGVVEAERERPSDPLHVVRGSLALRGADGGSAGTLEVVGTADTEERLISIRYSGEVCSSAQMVAKAVQP